MNWIDAAVMILIDDTFATIVKAVEYGRAIYDNLVKYIRFQMASLVGFIASFLGAALSGVGGGVPFSPVMILWLNFGITVPIAISLGFDKPSPGLMEREPRPLTQPVLSGSQWTRIAFLGILMAAGTLILEEAYAPRGAVMATTMAATVFSLLNIFAGLSARSETRSAFDRDILSDRRQLGLFGLSVLLTILATELGFLQRMLGTTSLSRDQWLLCVVVAFVLLLADEVIKLFMLMRHPQRRDLRHRASPVPT